MAFSVKLACVVACSTFHLFQRKKGFEKIFYNFAFKRMNSLKKIIQSLVDFIQTTGFWTHATSRKF